MRRLPLLLALVALSSTACARSTSPPPARAARAAGPAVNGFRVEVDGGAGVAQQAFLAYFPAEVKTHPGDTVVFRSNFNGEPHSVTLGTAVTAGLQAVDALGPGAQGPPPAAMAALPQMLPEGPGDANQIAVNPCFIAAGAIPRDAGQPCPKIPQPPFTGRETYYNSGFLSDKADFAVPLANDIAPGTYRYYCNLHGSEMQGRITVLPLATPVPDPSEQQKQGQNELGAIRQRLQAATDALRNGSHPELATVVPKGPAAVLAGSFTESAPNATINEFGPVSVSVPPGGSVTWTVLGPHTLSFNAPREASDTFVKDARGDYHLNAVVVAPAGWPAPPEPQGPPSTGPPRLKVMDLGRWDGSGYRSTGLVFSFPPALAGFKLTFTNPGTYLYRCLIHPGMAGVVKVG